MIVDATAPTVNGLENNKTYCGDVKFTVTDDYAVDEESNGHHR